MQTRYWLCIAGTCLAPSVSQAVGIRILGQDTYAVARGNAVIASADNPSAVYYNPAGITQLPGHQFRASAYFISLKSEFTSPGGASFETKDDVKAVPTFYYTYTPEELPLSFGLGLYSPFGLGSEWPDDNPFRPLALKGEIRYGTLNPVVAWKVTEQFSIAAGPAFNYSEVELTRGIPGVPGPGTRLRFQGDGTSVGFTAGARYQPTGQHAFGLVYRSETDLNYKGDSDVNVPVPSGPIPSSAEFTFPQVIGAGYSFTPNDKWNLEVAVDWTDWHSLNTVALQQPGGALLLPFNWQASFVYSLGASYFCENGWVLSGGYEFSENSVPDESFNPAIADSDRHIFSLGVNRYFERWDVGLAYQLGYGPTRTISETAPPTLLANGEYEFISHAVSVQLGLRF